MMLVKHTIEIERQDNKYFLMTEALNEQMETCIKTQREIEQDDILKLCGQFDWIKTDKYWTYSLWYYLP